MPPSNPASELAPDGGLLAESRCRYGNFWYVRQDDPIGMSLRTYGEWAQLEIDFLVSFLQAGSTVLDVGANVGTHTVAFASAVGVTGQVESFEPQPLIFEVLRRNVVQHSLANVKLHRAGVGESAGHLRILEMDYTAHVNAGAVELVNDETVGNGTDVAIVSIDSLELQRCDLLKIDVEGMEPAALRGARQTINGLRPVVFTECNSIDAAISQWQAIDWNDYSIFVVRTSAHNPDNFTSVRENAFGWAQETGLLFVPDERLSQVPTSTPHASSTRVSDFETMAAAILSTPRFGDLGPHDRDAKFLRGVLTECEEQQRRLQSRVDELQFLLDETLGSERSLRRNLQDRSETALAEFDSLSSQVNFLRGELQALRDSTSWRVTRPIRIASVCRSQLGQLLQRGLGRR